MTQTHYHRNLPHILPPGECIFITYRLAGSIPSEVLFRMLEERQATIRHVEQADGIDARDAKYKINKRYFAFFDRYLDTAEAGPQWLKEPAVASLVKEGIHHRDEIDYALYAYCIMSNHVHLLISIRMDQRPFHQTLKSLKGYSARQANKLLNLTGQSFWQPESYDHVVRNDEEFKRIVAYILNNPVKSGLVDQWEDWPHSYLRNDL